MHPDIYEAFDKIAGKGSKSKKRRQRKRQEAKKSRMRSSAPAQGAPAPKPPPAATQAAPAPKTAPAAPKPKASLRKLSLSRNMKRGLGGGVAALAVGSAAYGLHRRNKKSSRQKTASIAEYSVLLDKVAGGDLGEHARQALLGICDTIPEPDTLSEKSASVYDATDLSEDAARKARLDQLLRR